MMRTRLLLWTCLYAIVLIRAVNSFSTQSPIRAMTFGSDSLRSRGQKHHMTTTAAGENDAINDKKIANDTGNSKSDTGGIKNTLIIVSENLPLQRTHERVLFAAYLVSGLAVSRAITDTLLAQSTIALVWMTFSLAISFMEAWVKFKAPLLRKYVAVDVGRHVFCAQHAVELGLATSFWISAAKRGVNSAMYSAAIVSTALYIVLAFFVGPLLYFRAKYKMVNEPDAEQLTTEERSTIDDLARGINGKKLPHAQWHVIYVLLDTIKVVGLGIFARTCLVTVS